MSQVLTDWFTADGVSSTYTLTVAPANNQVEGVFLNGLLLRPPSYNLSGQHLTLVDLPNAGDEVAIKYEVSGAATGPSGTSPAPYGPFPAPGAAAPASSSTAGGALINVAEVINDPDLAQPFTILRSAGAWKNGVWSSQTTEIPAFGVISVAQVQDVEMIPQGDRIHGAMLFHSTQQILTTSSEKKASSDILLWNNQKFRVLQQLPYSDYGYWSVIATRMDAGG